MDSLIRVLLLVVIPLGVALFFVHTLRAGMMPWEWIWESLPSGFTGMFERR